MNKQMLLMELKELVEMIENDEITFAKPYINWYEKTTKHYPVLKNRAKFKRLRISVRQRLLDFEREIYDWEYCRKLDDKLGVWDND